MPAYANTLRNLATGNLKILQLPNHPRHNHQPYDATHESQRTVANGLHLSQAIARQWLAIGFASHCLQSGNDISPRQYDRWRSFVKLEG